jgi:N-acetyl-gamma-glutamyl-phosphate reductase
MGTQETIPVGIVGASGYGGVQLVRLLLDHPYLQLAYLGGNSSAGQAYGELYPHLATGQWTIEPIDLDAIAQRVKIAFLALPNGLAMQMAPPLLAKGLKVLDLSADYRFQDLSTYQTWYGTQRNDEEIANTAVYGLPELFGDRLTNATLVGCPGCYPTASLLAIAPLLKHGLIGLDSIIIDAKSGTSGGGRQGKINLLLAEAEGTIAAYGVAHHRHTPEIEQICSLLAGQEIQVQFTPHLVPMPRGILATVYANMRDPGLVREDLITIYKSFYRDATWVEILPNGVYPQTKWATGTNRCFLGIELDERTGRVIVMSAIDNLLKGQASQAIQCLNVMMGWPESLGLPTHTFYP